MKRLWIKLLAIVGCVCILSGLGLLALGTYTVRAQDDQPVAEYIGSDDCADCHRSLARSHGDSIHALALQDVSRKKTAILADFDQGEEIRTVTLPGEDSPRAFTAKDIAFAVGVGQHVQRYLYEVDKNDYMVLPAEWNVEAQTWEPLQLADTWPAEQYDWEQNCAYCHTTGFEVERDRWKDDGVQCEACHGPGSIHQDQAKDAGRNPNDEELLAIRAAIYTKPDSQVCGQCHSQGIGSDNHPYPVGYVPGEDLSQLFQLVPKDSADHWWVTGHASQSNMQYNEWLNGTHSSSLTDMLKSDDAADKCLTCHSQDFRQTAAQIAAVESGDREGQPPEAVTITSAQSGITCTTCHYQHTDSEQPFELVDEANSLCMSCHTNPTDETSIHHPVKEMFEGVTLVDGIEGIPGAHFKAEDGPKCMTCHMQDVPVGTTSRVSHLFKPILPGEADDKLPSACSGCHDDLTSTDLQLLVDDTRQTVRSRLTDAVAVFETIPEPQAGSDEAARYAQISAALSFVQNDGSLGIHNYTYTDALLSTAEQDIALLTGTASTTEPPSTPVPTVVAANVTPEAALAEEPVPSGVRPVTIIFIGAVVAVLLTAAFAFFRKPGD